MASTYTTNLRLNQQGTGDNTNTWGVILNTQLNLLDDAISGTETYTAVDGDNMLTNNNGADDEARACNLVVTGALTTTANIIYPDNMSFKKIIVNDTSGGKPLLVKNVSGSGFTVPTSTACLVYSDGTTVKSAAPLVDSDGNIYFSEDNPLPKITTVRVSASIGNLNNVYSQSIHVASSVSTSALNATNIDTDSLTTGTISSFAATSVSLTSPVIIDASISGGSMQNVAITDCDNVVFGAGESISGGEGTNPNYVVTINGGSGIALERYGGTGGCMIESKVGGNTTTPASEFDSGLQLASSGNDADGVLQEYARARGFVLSTPISGHGGVGGGFDILLANGAGLFGVHTRYNGVDSTTETRFKDSTSRSEVAHLRIVACCNGEDVTLNRGVGVSSFTEPSSSNYRLNFSSSLPDTDYTINIQLGDPDSTGSGWLQAKILNKTTTYVDFVCVEGNFGASNLARPPIIDIQIER